SASYWFGFRKKQYRNENARVGDRLAEKGHLTKKRKPRQPTAGACEYMYTRGRSLEAGGRHVTILVGNGDGYIATRLHRVDVGKVVCKRVPFVVDQLVILIDMQRNILCICILTFRYGDQEFAFFVHQFRDVDEAAGLNPGRMIDGNGFTRLAVNDLYGVDAGFKALEVERLNKATPFHSVSEDSALICVIDIELNLTSLFGLIHHLVYWAMPDRERRQAVFVARLSGERR